MFCVMIMIMRIDRLLCELNIGTRSQVKDFLKKGQVTVNGVVVKKADTQVKEKEDQVVCQGKEYTYRPFVYYMMNKPAGIITATRDEKEQTVMDLFREKMKAASQGELTGIPIKDIFPVGRLDKDTVGLLLLTNDGELAHRLLAPGRHVPKTYFVRTDLPLDERGAELLEKGVDIGEKSPTRPAQLTRVGETAFRLTITEGKFHQVKRMFQAVGLKVLYLKRISMGGLSLEDDLPEGQIRELSKEEVLRLCSLT